MVGRKVIHKQTGKIYDLKRYCESGVALLSDGREIDIHIMNNPDDHSGKAWEWYDEVPTTPVEINNYSIF